MADPLTSAPINGSANALASSTNRPAGDGASPEDPGPGANSVFETMTQIWQDFLAHVPLLVAGLILLAATAVVAGLFDRVSSRLLGKVDLRNSLKELISRVIYLGIWIVGLLVVAMVVFPGITPARALTTLGLGSIAIGFAFKDIFENFFAGILLLWRFPFENGDFIECDGILGKVEDVTVRNTLIRKTSGELVVVPNGKLFKNPVDVLTNLPHRRVTVICGVAYDEDVDEARDVIEQAVKDCSSVKTSEPVEIFAQEFADSSINFEVTWWTDPEPLGIRSSRDQVVAAVKRALDEAGIEIPFPYRTLTFKEPLRTIEGGDQNEEAPRDEEASDKPEESKDGSAQD